MIILTGVLISLALNHGANHEPKHMKKREWFRKSKHMAESV